MRQSDPRASDDARAIVAAEDPSIVRRVAAGLESLACPYSVVQPSACAVSAGPCGVVYCLCSRVACELPHFPGPTVVILSGARLTDDALARLQDRRMYTLRLDGLSPASLLRAMVCARSGSEVESLAMQLSRMRRLDGIPPTLITAFLEDPAGMLRIHDLRRALPRLSRESAQALVRSAGFSRAEHLFTALRGGAWVLLKQQGMSRKEVERYLGISDRTSFRRACKRAGIPALHERLSSEVFGQG